MDATMDFVANFMSADQDPIAWSQTRESEGWQVLGCADHFWSANRTFPHLWVTLATMAASTTRPLITSSFANNLFRSPVEFAQAALQNASSVRRTFRGRARRGLDS
jgi:alkanesulfonate monooxygenase SsuD/methylene tetrahydromethanopterin reductase-like flavin-dependent oxidoreductase (luciferase family)